VARKQGFFAKLITSILKDAIAPTPEPRAERERRGPPSVPVRMTDLANLMAALRVDPDDRDAMAIALLQREPNNRYDRNAVRVLIHGRHVGYISREDAEDIQGWIRGLERAGIPAYVLARMGGGRVDEGRVGPIGVTLEDLPAVFG